MNGFSAVSDFVQKFGLIFGKKQVYKIICGFLNGFEKAGFALIACPAENGRYSVNIFGREAAPEDALVQISRFLEPFMAKYYAASGANPPAGISNFLDFEFHSESSAGFLKHDPKKRFEIKGSLVIPVFLENKIYSLFGIFSENEFELGKDELSTLNILAYISAVSLKTLSVSHKMQTLVDGLTREKADAHERNLKYSTILELSQKLVANASYETLLSETLNAYRRVFGIKEAAIMGLNHHKNELFVEHAEGFANDYMQNYKIPLSYGIIGAVAQKGEPYFRKGPFASGEELAVIPYKGLSGIVCGAIVLYDRFEKLSFSDEECELMWMLSNFFSLALNMIKVRSVNETRVISPKPDAITPDELIEWDFLQRTHESAATANMLSSAKLLKCNNAVVFKSENGELSVFARQAGTFQNEFNAEYIYALKNALNAGKEISIINHNVFSKDAGDEKASSVIILLKRERDDNFIYIFSGFYSQEPKTENETSLITIKKMIVKSHDIVSALMAQSAPNILTPSDHSAACREIQRLLEPSVKDVHPKLDMAAFCEPAENPGCDIYGLFKSPNNNLSLFIADVSGRGLNSAVISAMLRAQIRTLVNYNFELRKLLYELNNLICEDIGIYNYVTMFLMQISPNAGRAAFCNAGQSPVLHYIKEGGSVVIHESKNSPLGIMRNQDYKEGMLLLNQGDVLLVYTNGLSELRNASREAFGRERLAAILKSNAAMSAEEIKNSIVCDAKAFAPEAGAFDDDITFVIIKVV